MRRIFSILSVALLLLGISAPARAGGSWLEPSGERFEPGDYIELSGRVSPGQLGWLDDGPFYAYLRGEAWGTTIAIANGGTVTDVPLGKVSVSERRTSTEVSVSFTLAAETPPGEYRIVTCNDPCTTGLGDLIGGVLYVAMDPPTENAVDENETPRRTYTALAPQPSRPTGLNVAWVAMSAGLGLLVLLLVSVARDNRD